MALAPLVYPAITPAVPVGIVQSWFSAGRLSTTRSPTQSRFNFGPWELGIVVFQCDRQRVTEQQYLFARGLVADFHFYFGNVHTASSSVGLGHTPIYSDDVAPYHTANRSGGIRTRITCALVA